MTKKNQPDYICADNILHLPPNESVEIPAPGCSAGHLRAPLQLQPGQLSPDRPIQVMCKPEAEPVGKSPEHESVESVFISLIVSLLPV
jgi:hypothetical protein